MTTLLCTTCHIERKKVRTAEYVTLGESYCADCFHEWLKKPEKTKEEREDDEQMIAIPTWRGEDIDMGVLGCGYRFVKKKDLEKEDKSAATVHGLPRLEDIHENPSDLDRTMYYGRHYKNKGACKECCKKESNE